MATKKQKNNHHLLIDGYNVIHAWDGFSSIRKTDMPGAVSLLAEKVRVIHDVEGLRTTLVFDGNGSDITIERPSNEVTFSLVYTPKGMTADDFIEQMALRAKVPSSITVISQDNLLRNTIEAAGAIALSPESLDDWIKRCRVQQKHQVDKQRQESNKSWKPNGDVWDVLDEV